MSFDWSGALQAELCRRADGLAKRRSLPCYASRGASARLFQPFDSGMRHGNFIDASYRAILAEPAWNARAQKTHSHASALSGDGRDNARELDSSNSSDALLMNCFCFPGAAERILNLLLPSVPYVPPQFGVPGEVALVSGELDTTELDMRIGSAIFEAKLTERDFTNAQKSHVERYARFVTVFAVDALPQTSQKYRGYQLIRNVLTAEQHGWTFHVLCDARRPDLLHEWWAVHAAIRDSALRSRCGFLLWQEIAEVCPLPLREFLDDKYGLVNGNHAQ